MMKRVLVTGAGGQIGADLVRCLRREAVVVATDLTGPTYLNVTQKEQVRRVMAEHQPDTVIHLAAMLSAKGEGDVARTLEVNNLGTQHILEAAIDCGAVEKVFLPSSIAVYGGGSSLLSAAPETASCRPTTIYGVTKLYNELLGEYYHQRHGLDVRILRLPGVISALAPPGGGTTDWAVDMYKAAAVKKEKAPYRCFLAPTTTMPMLYVDDLLRGVRSFLDADASALKRRTYNLGGFSFSPEDLAAHLNIDVDYAPDFRQAIADSWPRRLNDDAAREDWGWQPQFDDLHTMTQSILPRLTADLSNNNNNNDENIHGPNIRIHVYEHNNTLATARH